MFKYTLNSTRRIKSTTWTTNVGVRFHYMVWGSSWHMKWSGGRQTTNWRPPYKIFSPSGTNGLPYICQNTTIMEVTITAIIEAYTFCLCTSLFKKCSSYQVQRTCFQNPWFLPTARMSSSWVYFVIHMVSTKKIYLKFQKAPGAWDMTYLMTLTKWVSQGSAVPPKMSIWYCKHLKSYIIIIPLHILS